MGAIKNFKIGYEDLMGHVDQLDSEIQMVYKLSKNKKHIIKEINNIKISLSLINTYLKQEDILNIDGNFIDDLSALIHSSSDIISRTDDKAEINDDNIILLNNSITIFTLKYLSTIIEHKLKEAENLYKNERNKNIVLLQENRDIISTLKSKIDEINNELKTLEYSKNELKKQITNKKFEANNEILAAKYDEKHMNLKNKIKYYLLPAISLTTSLGAIYLYFFYSKFDTPGFSYINHLMLIAVCSPFIFLTIWLFFQVSRLTRLSEIYSFKSSLGCTIRDTIAFAQNTEKDNKEQTMALLIELVYKLHESPFHISDKNVIPKNLPEITDLLKEIKEIVGAINPIQRK